MSTITVGLRTPHNSRFTIEQVRDGAGSLPALIDAATVAALAGVSVRHIQRMASTGKLPCVRVGNRYRFNTVDVLERLGLSEAMTDAR
jgi:excisionase family DNA binding protein